MSQSDEKSDGALAYTVTFQSSYNMTIFKDNYCNSELWGAAGNRDAVIIHDWLRNMGTWSWSEAFLGSKGNSEDIGLFDRITESLAGFYDRIESSIPRSKGIQK